MKIALFLGSFNPFHNGHLECVKKALNDFKMDKVIIVPIMQNDLDRGERILDIDKRAEIISHSICNDDDIWSSTYYIFSYHNNSDPEYRFPVIKIDLIEKELIPPYYSYATLHALKNKYCNSEIFILCGEDTIKEISDWMNGEQILKDYSFLVVDRPKESISSSQIREILKNKNKLDNYTDGKLKYFVSPSVIELLKKYY